MPSCTNTPLLPGSSSSLKLEDLILPLAMFVALFFPLTKITPPPFIARDIPALKSYVL